MRFTLKVVATLTPGAEGLGPCEWDLTEQLGSEVLKLIAQKQESAAIPDRRNEPVHARARRAYQDLGANGVTSLELTKRMLACGWVTKALSPNNTVHGCLKQSRAWVRRDGLWFPADALPESIAGEEGK